MNPNPNPNLIMDNNLFYGGILIGCGVLLGLSLYYLIKSNYTAIPNKNTEAFTNEEIEAILNEHRDITAVSNENIDAYLTESDFETDIETDHDTIFGEESSSDDESTLGEDFTDLDLFFMPNVDLEVCTIQELKFFEISSIYYREIAEKEVTDEELMELMNYLTEAELMTNKINQFILDVISCM
jgi:hypothetical protein